MQGKVNCFQLCIYIYTIYIYIYIYAEPNKNNSTNDIYETIYYYRYR